MKHTDCAHPATKAARAACRARVEKLRSYDPTEVRVIRVVPAEGRTPFYAVMRGTDVLETCLTRKEANAIKADVEGQDLHRGCYGD